MAINVGAHTKFGLCQGCQSWVVRDSMLGMNVKFYDEQNDEHRIPVRFCPDCHGRVWAQFKGIEWCNEMKTLEELRAEGIEVASDALAA